MIDATSWTRRRFRASPRLELKRLDELPPEQREPFRELERDDDFYGLLVPRAPASISIKSVGEQTASLFRELLAPANIDATLLADDDYRGDVIDLVLDGVLEIEHDSRFVTGAAAFPLVCPTPKTIAGDDAIGRISAEALEHAIDLATDDAGALTTALYTYYRIPLSRFWLARWPGREEVLAEIGASGDLRGFMDRYWSLIPTESSPAWISWQSRSAAPRHRHDTIGMTWKLYVSPRPEHIRDGFAALVRVLAEIPGAQMKIGRDAAGLLRPDKLVSYFTSREDLDRAATALAAELRGCPAHGIPFTAGVDADGLLSWGVDPPDSARALSWMGRESWRLWIATRLGAALSLAKSSGVTGDDALAFAVERVRRHGVEVDTWTPGPSLWRTLA
jgi:hypothetical protein